MYSYRIVGRKAIVIVAIVIVVDVAVVEISDVVGVSGIRRAKPAIVIGVFAKRIVTSQKNTLFMLCATIAKPFAVRPHPAFEKLAGVVKHSRSVRECRDSLFRDDC